MTDLAQLPHDPEAERAVLAGLLSRPDRFKDFRATGLEPRSFYETPLRELFSVLTSMHEAGEPVDVLSVRQKLNGSSTLTPLALRDIADDFATVEHSLHQARRVVDLSTRREGVERAADVMHDFQSDAPPEQVADFASQSFRELVSPLGPDLAAWYATGDALRVDPPPAPPGVAWTVTETGEAIIRAGLRYLVVGEAGIGKSLLALGACIEVASVGGVAVFLDAEGDLPTFVRRLRIVTVGAASFAKDPTLADRIHYRAMHDRHDPRLPAPVGTRLVVLDGLGSALAREQLDENSAADFLGFLARVVDPLRAQAPEAAFLIIDHPGHADPGRGRGSSAKRPAVDVELTMKATGHDRAALIVRKDRHAVLGVPVGRAVAEVRRYADEDGGLALELREPNRSTDDAGHFRPTTLMGRVSRHLETRAEPVPMLDIEKNVKGKRAHDIRAAVAALVREGCASEDRGPNNARLVRFVRPFTEAGPSSSPSWDEPGRTERDERP